METCQSSGFERDFVKIRSFEPGDEESVRNIFACSMGAELRSSIFSVFLSGALRFYSFPFAVFALLMAMLFESLWYSVLVCFAAFISILVLVFLVHSRYVQTCLSKDLKAISHTYMGRRGAHMWVAECNGNIVGMVALTPKHAIRETVAELKRMCVSLDFRRRGVAKKLLDQLLSHAKHCGYEKVVLLTTTVHPAALKFYPKMGFHLVSKNPAHWALRGFHFYVFSYDL